MTDTFDGVYEPWVTPIARLAKAIKKNDSQDSLGAERRELNRVKQKHAWLSAAIERLQDGYPQLYQGLPDIELSPEQTDDLFAAVCQDAGGYQLREIQHYLVVGLAQGVRELGWQMPVPAPIAISRVESSNANPEMFRRLQQFDELDNAFYTRLERGEGAGKPDIVHDAGELLFSFCFHSGVCNKTWLKEIPNGIRAGAGVEQGIVWLDLGEENNLENTDYQDRRRRVFLAPVTQILLWRWYQRRGKTWPRDPKSRKIQSFDYLLEQFTKKLCQLAGLPSSVAGSCLRLSEANLVTTLPSTIVHYLLSNRIGAPLTAVNWHRLLTDQRDKTTQAGKDRKAELITAVKQVRVSGQFPDQKKLYKELLKGIKDEPNNVGREFISKFVDKEGVSPILQLMASWAGHLLEHGGVVKKKLSDRSVIRYLDWIRGLLVYADDLSDPLNVDEDSWQAIYDEIVANAHGAVADCAGRLSAFHQFLVQGYGIPPVDIAGMSADRQVDARILTPREYQRIREALQHRAAYDDLAECQELILILGYRLGLRRGEAYSRLFGDFAGLDDTLVDKSELLVRPNKNARIKSETSTRRLPIHILLTEDELTTLRRFYRRRQNVVAGNASKRPVFAEVAGGYWPAVTSRVFDPITDLLRQVTGDEKFRFHHLRHSFVTFTFLRLLEREPSEFIPREWRQDETGVDLLPAVGHRLWEKAGLPDTGQALWLMAMWAGHASPQVTLECYSHLLDWVVACYLNQRHDPKLNLECQQVLLDKSPSALERYRSRKQLTGSPTPASELCAVLAESWPVAGRKKPPSMQEHQPLVHESSELRIKIGWMDAYNLQLWSIQSVIEHGVEKARGLTKAAELVGISSETAERWDRNARSLMSMTTNRERAPHNQSALISPSPRPKLSRGTEDVMRSLDEKDLARRLPELPGQFLAPPNTPDTQSYAEKYFLGLVDWFERDPEHAELCMRAALESSQRSKSKIRPHGAVRQRLFFDLLRELGLKSRTTLAIKIAPETERKRVKKFWSDYFGVPPSSITCKLETLPQKLGINGRCHISVDAPPALDRGQNLFWSTLRFALLSAYVVCAHESVGGEEG